MEQELTKDKLNQLAHSERKEKVSSTVKSVKGTKSVVTGVSSRYSMRDPRILTGSDREKFMTTVFNSTFSPEIVDKECEKIGKKQVTKVTKLLEQQNDPQLLQKLSLPPVPKEYKGPIVSNNIENRRDNIFVVTNEAYSKQTNPGFSRKDG